MLQRTSSLNPIAAYRKRGQRYSVFVAAKCIFIGSLILLAVATLLLSVNEGQLVEFCFGMAMLALKIASVVIPFLAFEALYWWIRDKREGTDIVRHVDTVEGD